MTTTIKPEATLAQEIGRYADDLLGYVAFAYPWGKTKELSVVPWYEKDGTPREGMAPYCKRFPNMTHGLDLWACELSDRISKETRERGFDYTRSVKAIRTAVVSGHGIGKSAFVGVLVSWVLDTRPYSRGIVTANTGEQLRTRTFAEICKWKRRAITSSWFEISEGGMFVRHKSSTKDEPWGVVGQTWRKENSEAFAGQHSVTATSFYIFDEASAVHEKIWEVAQGGLSDGEPMIFVFGNPTRATGAFFECFHSQRHRWLTMNVDSRKAYITNKELFAEWVEDFGEDSDFVRVRVRGVFPRVGDSQFIPHDWVNAARRRQPYSEIDDAVVMGVDVARQGSDESVIMIRIGRDARTHEMKVYRESDTMQLVGKVAERYGEMETLGFEPDVIFVDGVGVGGGVVDRLRELGFPVIEVNNGEKATRSDRYYNKGAECWGLMKEWLRTGALPEDDEIFARQLTAREYSHDLKQRIVLEKKDDMKERGLDSPDRADALALTFASPIITRREKAGRPTGLKYQFSNGTYYGVATGHSSGRNRCLSDEDPFSRLGD